MYVSQISVQYAANLKEIVFISGGPRIQFLKAYKLTKFLFFLFYLLYYDVLDRWHHSVTHGLSKLWPVESAAILAGNGFCHYVNSTWKRKACIHTWTRCVLLLWCQIIEKRREEKLTVWQSRDTRPVAQNPISQVKVYLCLWPQLSRLKLSSKIHDGQGKTASKEKKHLLKLFIVKLYMTE